VGTKALVTELELANLQTFGSDDKHKPMNIALFDDLRVDEDIKAVVCLINYFHSLTVSNRLLESILNSIITKYAMHPSLYKREQYLLQRMMMSI